MNILVMGGAGYIGSHVVKQLLDETDHDVSILDNRYMDNTVNTTHPNRYWVENNVGKEQTA